MQTVMLMGAIGAGKSTLLRALSNNAFQPRRAMAMERHGRFLLTPGEFLENRRFYHALISTAADCGVLLFSTKARCKPLVNTPPLPGRVTISANGSCRSTPWSFLQR